MKMKKYGSFDEYFADQSPKNRSIIRTLRTFVKRVAPGLQESVKWGNGCRVMGSVPVAYVFSAADYVQFGFFRGSSLKDPQRILEGKGQYVRQYQSAQSRRHQRGRLQDALTASGSLTLICCTRSARSPSSGLYDGPLGSNPLNICAKHTFLDNCR